MNLECLVKGHLAGKCHLVVKSSQDAEWEGTCWRCDVPLYWMRPSDQPDLDLADSWGRGGGWTTDPTRSKFLTMPRTG